MKNSIVHSSDPITLLGAGEATPEDLHRALTLAPTCVAADGGVGLALSCDVEVAALIGDFDSLPETLRTTIPLERQHHIAEQDSTDFEKCLSRIEAPAVIGVGFTGGRLDHTLAAMHVLLRYAHRPCVLIGARELTFLAPPCIQLPTRSGDIVSLFPMAPVQGRSTGLAWPIDGLQFDPARQIGTSNQATGPCLIEMERPVMLMMVARRLLGSVVSQLAAPDGARWPVRG